MKKSTSLLSLIDLASAKFPFNYSDFQKIRKIVENDQYKNPLLAVDIIITSIYDVVLIERKNYPLGFALPGGFVEKGETTESAAVREAKEETNLNINEKDLKLFGVYSDPNRDARDHIVSIVYKIEVPHFDHLKAGDDAKVAIHMNVLKLRDYFNEQSNKFCDAHKPILKDFLDQTFQTFNLPKNNA